MLSLHCLLLRIAGEDMLDLLGRTLEKGMTPIVSYWKSPTMTWLDGRGPGETRMGLCDQGQDQSPECSGYGQKDVEFSFFSISDLA